MGNNDGIRRDHERRVRDRGKRVGDAGRIDVDALLDRRLQHILKRPKLLFREVFRLGGWDNFKFWKAKLCRSVRTKVGAAPGGYTVERICLRRGEADARITLFPLSSFRTGRSRGNGPRGTGFPADTAGAVLFGSAPCSIAAAS